MTPGRMARPCCVARRVLSSPGPATSLAWQVHPYRDPPAAAKQAEVFFHPCPTTQTAPRRRRYCHRANAGDDSEFRLSASVPIRTEGGRANWAVDLSPHSPTRGVDDRGYRKQGGLLSCDSIARNECPTRSPPQENPSRRWYEVSSVQRSRSLSLYDHSGGNMKWAPTTFSPVEVPETGRPGDDRSLFAR